MADTNLDLLVGETSYACNSINRIYPKTVWRPSRIFWGDMVRNETYPDIIAHFAEDYEIYMRGIVVDQLMGNHERIKAIPGPLVIPPSVRTYDVCAIHRHKPELIPDTWSPHFDEPGLYCKFGGTLQMALQHAVEEGYPNIYLVGVDLGLTLGGINHFEDYPTKGESKQDAIDRCNHYWLVAHELARIYIDKHHIRLLNATVGGQLEAYERVDFDRLF